MTHFIVYALALIWRISSPFVGWASEQTLKVGDQTIKVDVANLVLIMICYFPLTIGWVISGPLRSIYRAILEPVFGSLTIGNTEAKMGRFKRTNSTIR